MTESELQDKLDEILNRLSKLETEMSTLKLMEDFKKGNEIHETNYSGTWVPTEVKDRGNWPNMNPIISGWRNKNDK